MGTLAQAIHSGQLRTPGTGGRRPDILAVMATAGRARPALSLEPLLCSV